MSSLYALVAFSLLAFACSSASSATVKPLCKAGESSYCRCKDRAEGSKVCHADGEGFDACLPCETASNPEDTSGTTYPPYDSGAPSTCGNGSVEDGEECDDGNAVADDGCSSACRLEGADALSSRSCPGMPIHVGASTVEFLTTTVGAPNTTSVKRPCDGSTTTGSAAADRIFAVVAQKTGAMTVTTTDTDFDNWIYVVPNGCTAGAQASVLACENRAIGKGGETATFPVESGKTYSVIVDGVSTAQGTFQLSLVIR